MKNPLPPPFCVLPGAVLLFTGLAVAFVVAAENDKKSIQKDGDSEMTGLKSNLQHERAAGIRAALAQYADRLAGLRTRLLGRGDTEGAARVQLEMDRVLPAVAAPPGVAEKDNGDVGIFEDAPESDGERAAASLLSDEDLEKLVASLAADSGKSTPPAAAAAAAATTVPGARVPLRMTAASYLPALPATNPPKGHLIWTAARTASWTLRDLVPGHYRLLVRYGAEEEIGGGTLLVRLGREKLTVPISTTGGWSRRTELLTDPIAVSATSADLTLGTAPDTAGGTWLFDLQGVTLVPAAGPEKSAKDPAE